MKGMGTFSPLTSPTLPNIIITPLKSTNEAFSFDFLKLYTKESLVFLQFLPALP